MLNLSDNSFLIEIIADTVLQAHLTCPEKELRDDWINAVARAAVVLEGDTSFLHWDAAENALFCWSPDEGEICKATERHCQSCAIPQNSQAPCHHRALSRLAGNYFELQRKPGETVQIDFADAVFFDRELLVRQKIELLNLSILEGRTDLKPLVQALENHVIS